MRSVLGELAKEVEDDRLVALVRQTLQSGVYEKGLVRPMTVGLPQGSPLSPLLANVVLHPLDAQLEATRWEFARYADDCLVLLPQEELGPKARQIVIQTLGDLGLRLNEQKTAFGHFTAARFLGFAFRQDADGGAIREVSPEALAEPKRRFCGWCRLLAMARKWWPSRLPGCCKVGWPISYTAAAETPLRALVNRIVNAWRERFPGATLPTCLRWETLCRKHSTGERVDYSGHFQDSGASGDSINWTDSVRCLLLRLLRSRWWRLEYDLASASFVVSRLRGAHTKSISFLRGDVDRICACPRRCRFRRARRKQSRSNFLPREASERKHLLARDGSWGNRLRRQRQAIEKLFPCSSKVRFKACLQTAFG